MAPPQPSEAGYGVAVRDCAYISSIVPTLHSLGAIRCLLEISLLLRLNLGGYKHEFTLASFLRCLLEVTNSLPCSETLGVKSLPLCKPLVHLFT